MTSDEDRAGPPSGRRLAAVVPALKAWLDSLAVSRKDLAGDAVAGVPGAVGSVPDGMAASVLVGVNPVHGLYASFAGPIFGGLDLKHPPHGDHDHERRGASGGLGAAELQRGGARAGAHHPHPARRRADGGRRNLPPRSLHALRLALGHARLPHRRRRQHRAQSGRRLHGREGERRRRAHAGHRHRPPPRAHPGGSRCSSAARRWSCSSCSRGRASRPTPRSSPSSCRACSPWRCPQWQRSRTSARYPPASRCPPCRRCTCSSRPTS